MLLNCTWEKTIHWHLEEEEDSANIDLKNCRDPTSRHRPINPVEIQKLHAFKVETFTRKFCIGRTGWSENFPDCKIRHCEIRKVCEMRNISFSNFKQLNFTTFLVQCLWQCVSVSETGNYRPLSDNPSLDRSSTAPSSRHERKRLPISLLNAIQTRNVPWTRWAKGLGNCTLSPSKPLVPVFSEGSRAVYSAKGEGKKRLSNEVVLQSCWRVPLYHTLIFRGKKEES